MCRCRQDSRAEYTVAGRAGRGEVQGTSMYLSSTCLSHVGSGRRAQRSAAVQVWLSECDCCACTAGAEGPNSGTGRGSGGQPAAATAHHDVLGREGAPLLTHCGRGLQYTRTHACTHAHTHAHTRTHAHIHAHAHAHTQWSAAHFSELLQMHARTRPTLLLRLHLCLRSCTASSHAAAPFRIAGMDGCALLIRRAALRCSAMHATSARSAGESPRTHWWLRGPSGLRSSPAVPPAAERVRG
jgi:hypothetical protein